MVEAKDVNDRPPSSTADLIVEAAITILGRDGYQKLTARNVAAEAGTNLALINYYFGGKQGLLLAVYDALEHQRFERQSRMYADADAPLSEKWRQAVEYYRQDLADGFVRIHHELLIQGISDPLLAERTRTRIKTWNDMLAVAAETQLPDLGLDVPTSTLITMFGAFWYGMEEMHLIGMSEKDVPFFKLLDQIGSWIEEQEQDSTSNES